MLGTPDTELDSGNAKITTQGPLFYGTHAVFGEKHIPKQHSSADCGLSALVYNAFLFRLLVSDKTTGRESNCITLSRGCGYGCIEKNPKDFQTWKKPERALTPM